MTEALVSLSGVSKHFQVGGRRPRPLRAVDGVSLDIARGETVGLVGESGCGKSTLGRLCLGLLEPTGGSVRFRGSDLSAMTTAGRRAFTRSAQIVFQDPYSSLDPRMKAGAIVAEGLAIHRRCRSRAEAREQVADLLVQVGLAPSDASRYPHEFSGGQRQRVGIARALAVGPEFVVCDEPVSALDVSVQAQIVNLLADLQEALGLAYLLISHDLAVVRHLSRRVAVMYLGRLVECRTADEVYCSPLHPYTRALLSAVPEPDPRRGGKRIILEGDPPSPVDPPSGCPFHPRCPDRLPPGLAGWSPCDTLVPRLASVGGNQEVACFLYPECADGGQGV